MENQFINFRIDHLSDYQINLLIQNFNLGEHFLSIFAGFSDPEIVFAVAKHKNTSAKTLDQLSKSNDHAVLRYIVIHPNTSVETLERLSQHSNITIASNACKVLARPKPKNLNFTLNFNDLLFDQKRELSKTVDFPLDVFEELVKDRDSKIRQNVAGNPNTPSKIIEDLSKDLDADVRYGVAQNPNTPTKILEVLAKDPDVGVRRGVAKNPKAPTKILEELAKDLVAWVRCDVAKNPNTPIHTLQMLLRDDRTIVSIAARLRKNLKDFDQNSNEIL